MDMNSIREDLERQMRPRSETHDSGVHDVEQLMLDGTDEFQSPEGCPKWTENQTLGNFLYKYSKIC